MKRPALGLVPDPPPGPFVCAGRAAGTLAGCAAIIASVLIRTNDTSPMCVDDFCKNLGAMDAYDKGTNQLVTPAEQEARMSLPQEHQSAKPTAPPLPAPPQTPVASIDDYRKYLEGPNYRALQQQTKIGDVCEFCSEMTLPENPPNVDHFTALLIIDEIVNSGELSKEDAAELADALGPLQGSQGVQSPEVG